MRKLGTGMQVEPAMIVALIQAALTLAIAFGVGITTEQHQAIIALASAALAIILGGGFTTRAFVYSQHSVEQIADDAFVAGVDAGKRA